MFFHGNLTDALNNALQMHEQRMVGQKLIAYKSLEAHEVETVVREIVHDKTTVGFVPGDFMESVGCGKNIMVEKTVRLKKYYIKTKYIQVRWNKYQGVDNHREELPELAQVQEITEKEFKFYTLNPEKLI